MLAQVVTAAAIVAGTLVLMHRRAAGRPWRVALAAALVVLPNLHFGWRFNPAQRAPQVGGTPTETLLLARTGPTRFARILTGQPLFLPPNLAQLLALDDVHGSSAAGLEPYLRLMQAADPRAVVGGKYFLAFQDVRVASTPLLRMLGVEFVASDAALPLADRPVTAGPVALFRNPRFLPRFYLVPTAEAYDDVRRARERLLSSAFDPEGSALVPRAQASAIGLLAGPPGGAPARAIVASVRRQDPHHIELDVDSPAGGVLVTSEAAYPGWQSRLDGKPAQTLLVNTAFRGLAVPAGAHRITMDYVPRSFRAGLAVTLAAMIAALAAWVRAR